MASKIQLNDKAVRKLAKLFIIFLQSQEAEDISDNEGAEDSEDEDEEPVPQALCTSCAARQSCTPPPAVPAGAALSSAPNPPPSVPTAATPATAPPVVTELPSAITRTEPVRQPPAAQTQEAIERRITVAELYSYSVDQLEGLLEETKLRLNCAMVAADRERFDDERAAALDVYNVLVPYRGPVDQPAGPLRGRQFPDTLGDQVHVDIEADDRFYAVIVGIDFTGVVRGHSQFDAVCPQGVRLVKGFRCRSKLHAEAVWRRAAYKVEIGTIRPPPPPVVVIPFVPQFLGIPAK